MAAQWYYLDNGNETGPIGGSQLKKLADAGIVFPWTPVKRVSGSDVSPWTRAGAIQGMFAGDVREQLGDPICDDCGHRLEDGSCPVCHDAPPIFEPIEDEETVGPSESAVASAIPQLHPDDDWKDAMLRFCGFAEFTLAAFLMMAYVSKTTDPTAYRFHSDNAVGASANALEHLQLLLIVWLNVFGGFAFFGYAALRRIRNAIAPAVPRRIFR